MIVKIEDTVVGVSVDFIDKSNDNEIRVFYKNGEVDLTDNDSVDEIVEKLNSAKLSEDNGYLSYSFFKLIYGEDIVSKHNEFIDKVIERINSFYLANAPEFPEPVDEPIEDADEEENVPARPSDKVDTEKYAHFVNIATEYVSKVVDPDNVLADDVVESIVDGLTEFACWIYTR